MSTSKKGPKTELGKKQSAKNSTKHGLRSEALTSEQQSIDQAQFLEELVNHYQPVGPLEKMQLERIATCRAKLKALYELEEAKQALMLKNHQVNRLNYPKKLTHHEPLVQGMLGELMLFNQLVLPLGLSAKLLEAIVTEIQVFSGTITSDDDFLEFFPTLVSYLSDMDTNQKNVHLILLGVAKKLNFVIENGDIYVERLKQILPSRFEEKVTERTPEQIEFDRQLDEYQEMARIRRGEKPRLNIKPEEPTFPDMNQINDAFNKFKTIWYAYVAALNSIHDVLSQVELEKKALSLPAEEADLLIRYQTMWERRLSTLMGEFMQMQKMRVINESAQTLLARSDHKT